MKTLERRQASPISTNNAIKEECYSLVIPHHDHASFVTFEHLRRLAVSSRRYILFIFLFDKPLLCNNGHVYVC